jgi:hypothetical protein
LHRKDGACAPEKWDADGAASLPWGAIGAVAPGFKARKFETLGSRAECGEQVGFFFSGRHGLEFAFLKERQSWVLEAGEFVLVGGPGYDFE